MFVLFFSTTFYSQNNPYLKSDSLGLPGDNLNLNAVLDLFKNSESIQDFEKQLNTSNNKVNNLDLNNDGKTDYIKVQEYGKSDNHTLVLQDILDSNEIQDVAVINVSKKDDGNVKVQIIGDKQLYGNNYIIEPNTQFNVADSPTITPQQQDTLQKKTNVIVNNTNQNNTPIVNNNYVTNNYYSGGNYYRPSAWSIIRLMFMPNYTYWISPYYWGYYPYWWSPWAPVYYPTYCSYWVGNSWGTYYNRTTVFYNSWGYRRYSWFNRTSSPMVQRNIRQNIYRANSYNAVAANNHKIYTGTRSNWGGFSNTSIMQKTNYDKPRRASWGGFVSGNSTNNSTPRNFNNNSFSLPHRSYSNGGFEKPHNTFQFTPRGSSFQGGFSSPRSFNHSYFSIHQQSFSMPARSNFGGSSFHGGGGFHGGGFHR